MYHSLLKNLLSVRVTSPNELCRAEIGAESVRSIIKKRQRKFLIAAKDDNSRSAHSDRLAFALSLAEQGNIPAWRYN